MEKEPRKASEVLLELEAKMEVLLNLARTQDLTIKLLSNKINILMEKNNSTTVESYNNGIKIEAMNTTPIGYELQPEPLPIEEKPKGFRRTSRPETYAGDDVFIKNETSVPVKFPIQIPQLQNPEVIIPNSVINTKFSEVNDSSVNKNIKSNLSENLVSIVQRVVDKNGKSVFLADVEILDEQTKQIVNKTRTNGAGKWMISLLPGQYKVFIRKRESLNKEKLEVIQNIQVDGIENLQNLPTVIIK